LNLLFPDSTHILHPEQRSQVHTDLGKKITAAMPAIKIASIIKIDFLLIAIPPTIFLTHYKAFDNQYPK